MPSFTITRPTPRVSQSVTRFTERSDFVRGSGGDDVLAPALDATQRGIFETLTGFVSEREAYRLVYFGLITRPISAVEAQNYSLLFEQSTIDFLNGLGFDFELPSRPAEALAILTAIGFPDFAPTPFDDGAFAGDDRIFGRGGDDIVIDVRGNNLVTTDEGDDFILVGDGNDRIFDDGGDNEIEASGGNNTITTGGGDDVIVTGDGTDTINAFDGDNTIDAGGGNNLVRGGDERDFVEVGLGDDFVDVLAGSLVLDDFGRAVRGTDGEVIENTVFVDLSTIFFGAVAPPRAGGDFHNVILDAGGSDTLRASANARNDQPGFPDREFAGDDLIVDDLSVRDAFNEFIETGTITVPFEIGDDNINAFAGDNQIYTFGGDDTVNTEEGDDIVFTSFLVAGDDDIDTGAGNDFVNPGEGSDRVRGGFGEDFYALEADGFVDTLVFQPGDVPALTGTGFAAAFPFAAASDSATGFTTSGEGADLIDFRGLDVGFDRVLQFNAAAFGLSVGGPGFDVLLFLDVDGSAATGGEAFTPGDLFPLVVADVTELLTADNFLFDAVA
jgi:Ca2+-binding RTX toxin-like protein